MKILLVIHGYPPRYNAGSEVYTRTLAHGLRDSGAEVSVFSREEDPFLPDYRLRTEFDPPGRDIPVHLINHPRSNSRFRNREIDNVFSSVLESTKPDIVHFGHINHLSTSLIEVAKDHGARVVFTLHDYWLMCPRGQFLRWGLTGTEPWVLCDRQEDVTCATMCFNRYVTGLEGPELGREIDYWTGWVGHRMSHIRSLCGMVDLFIAPSCTLLERHVREFGVPREKISYLDYGFDHRCLTGRQRTTEDRFVFGYIGRHHPSKGIDLLLRAFSRLAGNARLRIWGRQEGQVSCSLKRMCHDLGIPGGSVEWYPEYRNEDIVREVFDRCDCIVVPSIWDENSPLVIHEAQQTGVPVITSDHGGMEEYVKGGINGLTFRHRDHIALSGAMRRALEHRDLLRELGTRGYLDSPDGKVPSIGDHVMALMGLYRGLLAGPGGGGA